MESNLILFPRWPRGFLGEWVWARPNPIFEPGEPEGWWLIASDAEEHADRASYQPLEDERALFLEFAETDRTKAGVLDFAAEYGPLGCHKGLGPIGPKRPQVARTGEALALWQSEIEDMARAVDLLNARPKQLAEWIRISSNRATYQRADSLEVITSTRIRETLWSHLAEGGLSQEQRLRLASTFLIQRIANEKLSKHVALRLLYDPPSRRLESHQVPRNLLGVMWLQLARALEADKEFRRCSSCGRWYEVSPEAKRPEATYCSTACRMRAYRQRRSDARRRARLGETAEEIAASLGSRVDTVRGWIAKEEEQTNG